MNDKNRCSWVKNTPIYQTYHDTEWGKPVHDDHVLFEFLILEGAQAGLNWETILTKREEYRKAFYNFDPYRVSVISDDALVSLKTHAGIIRNRLKIESARKNARIFLNIQKEFASFDTYVWRFVGGKQRVGHWKNIKEIPTTTKESDALSADLKKRGMSFVGSTIMYAYMQAVGMVNDHTRDCFRYREEK